MDRRREPRFETSQPARVRLLGEDPVTLLGVVRNMSGKGMRLSLDRGLPLDAAVRVELGTSVLLGEVCYCQPEDSGYSVGLVLDQVLHHAAGLRPLVEAVSTEPPEPVPLAH